MKKVLSVLLSVLIVFSCFSICSFAVENGSTGSVKILSYNVSGLPDVSFLNDAEGDIQTNQIDMAKYVNEMDIDIFATQEDFAYNDVIVSNLTNFKYRTFHHGSVPVGDGTNIYTKSAPMYNEAHITWRSLYGLADNGADQFSQKGITYCCIEIADGVYIDFYNIHADAFDDENSIAARKDNYAQLLELINSRKVDRPVIVCGDFNTAFFTENQTYLREMVHEGGFKDAWVEYSNLGNYLFSAPIRLSDSIDRFIYKNGGGIELELESFERMMIPNRDGKSTSDHHSVYAEFTYTVTDASKITSDDLKVVAPNALTEYIRRIVVFIKALMLALSNIDTLLAYLNK